jgi:hypothetical protein
MIFTVRSLTADEELADPGTTYVFIIVLARGIA